MSEQTKVYKCKNCGGIMEFDIKTQGLKCPNCDNTAEIISDESSIIEHSLTLDDRRMLKVQDKGTSTMNCSGCGANMEIGNNDTATQVMF